MTRISNSPDRTQTAQLLEANCALDISLPLSKSAFMLPNIVPLPRHLVGDAHPTGLASETEHWSSCASRMVLLGPEAVRACGSTARAIPLRPEPQEGRMAKRLTDTALTILSSAAARDNLRVLPVPASIKAPKAVIKKTLDQLL